MSRKSPLSYLKMRTLFLILITIITASSALGKQTQVQGAQAPLKLKWYALNLVDTNQAAVAADLNGDGVKDIVVVGYKHSDHNYGDVIAIDGKTGKPLWIYEVLNKNGGITIQGHSPFDIADLDGDGKPEIIVSAWYTLVLHNDGTLFWSSSTGIAYQNYNANLDINGDGHPEIFVSSGLGPNQGADHMSTLSSEGNLLNEAWTWHPCWGGNTIGDANLDGVFELYTVDRRVTYSNYTSDSYYGGAMGARALDAATLQPLWNDPTVLCSSAPPILADVNKDGKLEVIVLDQSNNGIVVYNSDGTVNTSNGVYRKAATGMRAHSPATVYDIDGDGNLELISTREGSGVVWIWDLYKWQLDAIIPINSLEPPKLGDVNGDGKMEMIITNSTGTQNDRTFVYQYNSTIAGYSGYPIGKVTDEKWGTNSYSLVEDVDGDGLVEVVITSSMGGLYCYATTSPILNPAPRTNLQFYSENRQGAAVYLAPPIPTKPAIQSESPRSSTNGVSANPTLSASVVDYQRNPMNVAFMTNSSGTWTNLAGTTSTGNVYSVTPSGMDHPGTAYYWRVTATDTITSQSRTASYTFTTKSNPPTQSLPTLNKNANGDLIARPQNTADADGDPVTNVYRWTANGVPYFSLNLPFATRTSNAPLVLDTPFTDGFEGGLTQWTGSFTIVTSPAHSGSNALKVSSGSHTFTSRIIDTSSANGITVSLWYYNNGITTGAINLQLYNGTTYKTVLNLGTNKAQNTWQRFSYQTYDDAYLRDNLQVRISTSSLSATGAFYVDDITVACPTRTIDYSGLGNDATIHGATWTNKGVVGGAYVLDGVNDYLTINDNPTLLGDGAQQAISVELWIKPTASNNGAYILAKKQPLNSTGSYMMGFNSTGTANTLYWGVTSATLGWRSVKGPALPNNKWSYIVGTYSSGNGLKLYVNGTLRASKALSGNIATSPGNWMVNVMKNAVHGAPIYLGWDGGTDYHIPSQFTRWFKGVVDEVAIYPRALSATQISERFTETTIGQSSRSTLTAGELGSSQWAVTITPNDGFGDGVESTTSQIGVEPLSNIHLESKQTTGTTSNLGSLTFDSTSGTLPSDVSKDSGIAYSVQYTAASGYSFDHWETTGYLKVASTTASTTTVTVMGDGTLRAVYKASTTGTLTVTSPNGGQSWVRGTAHTLTWTSSGSPGANVKIELMKGSNVNRVISSSTANDGSYSWTIPSTQTVGTDYKIRITSTTSSAITDSSNSNFSITN